MRKMADSGQPQCIWYEITSLRQLGWWVQGEGIIREPLSAKPKMFEEIALKT